MKRLKILLGSGGGILAALATGVIIVMACTYDAKVKDPVLPSCEQAALSGSFYVSDHGKKIMAELWLDDTKVDWDTLTTAGSNHTINLSWSGAVPAGSHTTEVKGYVEVFTGYSYEDRVYTPPVYDCDLTVNIHGTNYNVAQFYNKPTGDDKHCHKINWGDLTVAQQNAFKAMHHNDYNYSSPNHGNWQSAYNSHITENPTAHVVTPGSWSACSAGYEVDPHDISKCRMANYTWQQMDSDSKTFMVESCTKPASASATPGTCGYNQETGSQTPVVLTLLGAIVHSSFGDITSSTTVTVPPGHYEWPWEAVEGYQGSGTLVFDAADCTPLPHDVELQHDATCTKDGIGGEWSFGISIGGDGSASTQDPTSGTWMDPTQLETANILWNVVWPDGYSQTYSDSVSEPENCDTPKPEPPPVCKDKPCGPRIDVRPPKGVCYAITYTAFRGCWWNSATGKCQEGEPQFRLICNDASSAALMNQGKLFQSQPVVGVDQPGWQQADVSIFDYTSKWFWLKGGATASQFWKDPALYRYTGGLWFVTCSQPIYYTVNGNHILLQSGQNRWEAALYVVETAWKVKKGEVSNAAYQCYWDKAALWAKDLVGPQLWKFNELPIPAKPTDCPK